MIYDLHIRPDRPGKRPVSRREVEFVLTRYPGVLRDATGRYVYPDEHRRSAMELDLGSGDVVESVKATLPHRFLRSNGHAGLTLCFDIADDLGWSVLDERHGGYLDRDFVPEILNRHKELGETLEELIDRRAGMVDRFKFHARTFTRPELLVCMILAAVLAGTGIVAFDLSQSSFLWLAGTAFLVLGLIKAIAQTLWYSRRKMATPRQAPSDLV